MAMSSINPFADMVAFVSELVPEMDMMRTTEDHQLEEKPQDVVEDHQPDEKEQVPEGDVVDATKEKEKKKKKKKGVDIEDMYSFNPDDLEKVQPAKKTKPAKDVPKEVTQKHIANTLKAMRRMAGEEDQESKKQDEAEQEAKESSALHRFPSPSRSRQITSSVMEQEEEQKEAGSTLSAMAAEFVPPRFSPASEGKEEEEVNPMVESALKKLTAFDPPRSESCTDSYWTQALFAPVQAEESVESCDSKACERDTDDSSKWTARLDFGKVFGKVSEIKQTLSSHLCCTGRLAPSSAAQRTIAKPAKDPSSGKVHEKVEIIEKKEADKEAEKQRDREREAAIKAVNAEVSAQRKEAQLEMDETLMDCFLQAVKTRIKDHDLPIMGTTLYGKMRASRKIGTSCDVKDSSFVWLRPFLETLEDDGFITLKPEVQDPTVVKINRSHKLIQTWKPWTWSQCVGSQKTGGRR
jgi:hypothetical protein